MEIEARASADKSEASRSCPAEQTSSMGEDRSLSEAHRALKSERSCLYYFFARPPLAIGIPFAFLVLATAILHFTQADVRVMEPFYGSPQRAWPFLNAQPWHAIYSFGTWPGWTLGFGGLALWIIRCRRGDEAATLGLFCALALALGPGLFVNTMLKPHFHRPRPNQLVRFGGAHAFTPVLVASGTGETRSFPSGHASMGFYLMTPAFVLLRRRPRWAAAFLVLGMTSGLILGVTRIVQGRHFPSDVVWAWAVVYFTALTLYYLLRLPHRDTLADSCDDHPTAPLRSRDTGNQDTNGRGTSQHKLSRTNRSATVESSWRSAA